MFIVLFFHLFCLIQALLVFSYYLSFSFCLKALYSIFKVLQFKNKARRIQLKQIVIKAIHGPCAQTKLYLWNRCFFSFFSRRPMCKLSCTMASQIIPWPFVVCNVFYDFLLSYSYKTIRTCIAARWSGDSHTSSRCQVRSLLQEAHSPCVMRPLWIS